MIDVDIKTSKQRAIKRYLEGGRLVQMSYIEKAYEQIQKDVPMYKKHIPNFKTIRNNEGDVTPALLKKLSNEVFSFFSSPVKNPIGRKVIDIMTKNGYKYYHDIPQEVKEENDLITLDRATLNWY